MQIVLQTGRYTSPTLLIEDLKSISDTRIERKELSVVFYGGGTIEFVVILTAITNLAVLADIIYRYIKELKRDKDESDLTILTKCEISTNKKKIGLGDIKYEKSISLKGKSLDELKILLEDNADMENKSVGL